MIGRIEKNNLVESHFGKNVVPVNTKDNINMGLNFSVELVE